MIVRANISVLLTLTKHTTQMEGTGNKANNQLVWFEGGCNKLPRSLSDVKYLPMERVLAKPSSFVRHAENHKNYNNTLSFRCEIIKPHKANKPLPVGWPCQWCLLLRPILRLPFAIGSVQGTQRGQLERRRTFRLSLVG